VTTAQPTQGTLGAAGTRLAGVILDGPVLLPLDGDELLDAPPAHDLAAHLRLHGPGPARTDGLLAAVEAAGLTGHGGGHVAVAAKWQRALAGGACRVVANGCESEPSSAKDTVLLRLRPHLVLDGLMLAARALGADEAVVRVHAGSPALEALAVALRERGAAGLAPPALRIEEGPGGYLAGESSAVLRALDGGPALPTFRRPGALRHDAVDGVVHNVETLARVALVARGAGRAGGLVTVLAGGLRTVLETPPDATVRGVLTAAGARSDRAVLAGGYGGTWLDVADGDPELWQPGAPTGAGLLAVLPPGVCGLGQTAALLGYLARSGAGQCGPCRFGLPALADLAARLAGRRPRRGDADRLRAVATQVRGRGACHHPDGAVRLLESALTVFAGDVEEHLRRRRCLDGGGPPAFPLPGEGR
jgi:NADH:ubiquinone oxidoreductase subunit F (NADH-binding)